MSEEELESIPWSTLVEDRGPDRSRLIYMAAGAVILFALAALAARTLWSPSTAETPVVALPATTVAPATTADVVAASVMFSEADLMASLDAESSRAAAAFAEWFVYDYFTVDGDPQAIENIAAALPPGAPTELLPHTSADKTSYVEWARTSRVTETSPGQFEVHVLFRTVSSRPGEPYERDRTRVVVIPLQISGSGGFRLTELPAPTWVPQRPDVPDWQSPIGPGAAGPKSAAAALSWRDTEFDGLKGELLGGEWRMLFKNALGSGIAWPFLIELPEEFGASSPPADG